LSLGHEVSILVLFNRYKGDDPDIHNVDASLRYRLQAKLHRALGNKQWELEQWGRMVAKNLLLLHRRKPIDVIDMEESYGWFGCVAERTNIPVVVKLHGPTFLVTPPTPVTNVSVKRRIELEGEALASIGTIISPSQCTLNDTISYYSLQPKHSQHIVNALTDRIDLPLWSLEKCEKNTMLFVGRFDLIKGADIVLNAFKILFSLNNDLKLVFVGPDYGIADMSGTIQNADHYLAQMFKGPELDAITFLGRRTPAEIEILRTQAAVTIVASRWENQSYTTLEAMLQGCPVVASASGGTAEIIRDNDTGRLFISEDASSLATVLGEVFSDTVNAADLGHRARQYVLTEHSSQAVGKATLQAYDKAISSFQTP